MLRKKNNVFRREQILNVTESSTVPFLLDFVNNKWIENNSHTQSLWSATGTSGGSVDPSITETMIGSDPTKTYSAYQVANDPLGPLYLLLKTYPDLMGSLIQAAAPTTTISSSMLTLQGFLKIFKDGGWLDFIKILKSAQGIKELGAFLDLLARRVGYPMNISDDIFDIFEGIIFEQSYGVVANQWNKFVNEVRKAQEKVNTTFDEEGNYVYSGYKISGFGINVISNISINMLTKGLNKLNSKVVDIKTYNAGLKRNVLVTKFEAVDGSVELIPA